MTDHMPRESSAPDVELTPQRIRQRVEELGAWFHNLNLNGVETAPAHFLGDFPRFKWERFREAIPEDLSGRTVLDIGCNAGFYSFEMKRRGADRVLGIDVDEDYLAQARFAAEVNGLDVEFRRLTLFELPRLGERFDVVLFLGVLYHLRYPLLALDLLHRFVAKDLFVFQSLQRGSQEVELVEPDYPFTEKQLFERAAYPRLHFVEQRYAGDPTNWWIPNRACTEAMLRSAGFGIESHPEKDVYVCRRLPREHEPDLSFVSTNNDRHGYG